MANPRDAGFQDGRAVGESIEWLKACAEIYNYNESDPLAVLMAGAAAWLNGGEHHPVMCDAETSPDFWHHYEVVTSCPPPPEVVSRP